MDVHELVSAVKELALELGRSPNRYEFCNRVKGGNYKVGKFGGFTALLTAAGLDTYGERRGGGKPRKIDNSIWDKDLESHLEEYKPRAAPTRTPYPRIASISDIHWPFHSERVIKAFLDFIEKNAPEIVVLNGDAWDMYSHSKYPRSQNQFTPRQEQELARKHNEEFWIEVKKRCPKARCVQMMGNHDIRPLKRIIETYPEAEDWVKEKITALFSFNGVETFHDAREELVVGDILIFHGYRSKLGDHRDYTHLNCIVGHTHLGGAVFRKIRGQVVWELNSGVAGDPESKGLSYTPQKITHWTPGFGWVDEYGPRFIAV